MALKLRLGYPFLLLSHSSSYPHHHPKNLFLLLFFKNAIKPPRASFGDVPFNRLTNTHNDNNNNNNNKDDSLMTSSWSGGDVMDDEMVYRASMLNDAKEVMEMVREEGNLKREEGGGVLSPLVCLRILESALHSNNSHLALSIFAAMRSSTVVRENGGLIGNWRWPRPDLSIYTTLVLGLAASLRVSDALLIISDICRVGASPVPAEEVPFGKVVRCPTCHIAVTVVQPQQGIQIASCAKCRYQYEFVSGDIVKIDSEEISMDAPAWKRWLGFVQILRQTIPSAVHSIVIQTPSGVSRTHRFATETPDVPAQPGERVTIALAAPSSVYREVGPFKFSPKSQKYYPGEPLCLTNHRDGRESPLVRAPSSSSKVSLLSPNVFLPLLVILASGDAASGIINPNLPQVLPVAAAASIAMGATFNSMVLPQFGLLPERMVDAIAIKQQLLAQYDLLQSRIKDLKISAENEVWMLARMCQLENKIFAVGEPSYRARRNKIKRVREGLENSLRGRMELIDSYAKISSMIEIEVEMDTNVLAAEASSNAESVAKQIQQIMELENLEERWRLQAEANDEVERLLSSEPPLSSEDQA